MSTQSILSIIFIIFGLIAGFFAAYEFLKKNTKPYDRVFFGLAMVSNLAIAVYVTFSFLGD